MKISKSSIIGAALGTLIEYYDYSLFILFLPILAPVFFPSNSAYGSLVKGYFLLSIAVIARPIGGFLWGQIGDIVGRKKALIGSISGIGIATIIIGITPSWHTIGVWAIFIIILAKIGQVLCFGGEYNGAAIYILEHVNQKHAGFMSGVITATVLAGGLIATILGIVITLPGMPTWSWRILFIGGGLFAFLGVFWRLNLLESPEFKPIEKSQYGLISMFKKFPRELLVGAFTGGFITTPFTTALAFVAPVLMTKEYITRHQLMLIQFLIIFIAILTVLISGWIADRLSAKKLMLWASISLIIFAYPLLYIIDKGNIYWTILSLIGLVIINEICFGPSNAYLKTIFPVEYRYRATAISFGFGMSLFGGITPLMENYLYTLTHHFATAAIWPILIGCGLLISLLINKLHQ